MLIALAKFHVIHLSVSRVIAETASRGAGGTLHMQLRLLVIITEGKREMKTEILMNYLEKQTQRERDAGKVEAAGARGIQN